MLRRALRAARSYAQPKAVVLMYHRVAELESDIWNLAVTPAHFEQHLRVLQQAGNVISTAELADRLKRNALQRRSVVVTFDDGYRDNHLVVKPLLERYQLPATFFIASGNSGEEKEFWWDELEAIFLLSEQLPSYFSLPINGNKIEADLTEEQHLSLSLRQQHRRWSAVNEAPPTLRAALFYRVWSLLKTLPHAGQQKTLHELRQWTGSPGAVRPGYPSMSVAELQELSRNELFTIGAHTVTHPALGSLAPAQQAKELSRNKAALQLIAQDIKYLAYPYGEYTNETVAIATDLAFEAAFTTQAQAATKDTALHCIGRFQVNDCTGEEFARYLRAWLR